MRHARDGAALGAAMPVGLREWLVVLGATALTLIPALLFLALTFRDRLRQAPLLHLVAVFFFSLFTIPPAGFLEDAAWELLSPLPVTGLAWFALDNLSIGIIEESIKFACFLMLLRGPPRPSPVAHTILYATAVSLGFAAMENVGYAWDLFGDWGIGGFLGARGLIATPSHMQDGVLMGFLAGLAITATTQGKRRLFWSLSLVLPALSHAFYDYCATLSEEYAVVPPLLSTLAMFAALAQVIGGLFLAAILIRRSVPRATVAAPVPALAPLRSNPAMTAIEACPHCSAPRPERDLACRHRGDESAPLLSEPAA